MQDIHVPLITLSQLIINILPKAHLKNPPIPSARPTYALEAGAKRFC